MGGFVVKRCGIEGSGNPHHYLSLVCPLDQCVYENLDLPFDRNEAVGCGSCGELLYFQGDNGTSVVCNLNTKQMKGLPPPRFEPPPHSGMLRAGCLGYDATSKDYKVIRYIYQFYHGEEDEDGVKRYLGCKARFELYSFRLGWWREVPTSATDGASVIDFLGVYVAKTGSCYWRAFLETTKETSFGGLQNDRFREHVLSFDFATESFSHFRLPEPTNGKYEDMEVAYKLVECRGLLGALVHWRRGGFMSGSPLSDSPLFVEIFVWKGTSWDLFCAVSLADDGELLGLRDNRLLFVEIKRSSRVGQLMVYDLKTGKSKKLGIYDHPGIMSVHSYVEDEETYSLSDSETIAMIPYVESTDPLPITSEDEEEERKTRMMSKKRPRMRRGGKSKTKTKTTVSKNKPHSRKRRRLTSKPVKARSSVNLASSPIDL